MKIIILFIIVLLCGCRSGNSSGSDKSQVPEKFPVEKTFDQARKIKAQKLAQNYIDTLNEALDSKDFTPMKKVLPSKLISPRAREIFVSMSKALEKFGTRKSCTFFGSTDCTFYCDFFWKYRFAKPTGDPQHPEQIFEVLYRIRVIHPEQSPAIVKADFIMR